MDATIVCNPTAGKRGGREPLSRAIDVLERGGWRIEVAVTTEPGDGIRLAREAVAAGRDAVLAAGGDGTINEVIQALVGTDTALGYLPYGTVNVWARELRLPLAPERAAAALITGRVERIDLGRANDRYFLLMAGLGFDGEVVRRAESLARHKSRLGIWPYAAAALATAAVYRGADIELRYDGLIRRVQALMLVVGNTRLYGGRFRFTPRAVGNDGRLDLCIVKGRSPLHLARQALPLVATGSVRFSEVEALRVREVTVGAERPVPYQLDGEPCGETPVHFQVASRSLRVIVPRAFDSDLLMPGEG